MRASDRERNVQDLRGRAEAMRRADGAIESQREGHLARDADRNADGRGDRAYGFPGCLEGD